MGSKTRQKFLHAGMGSGLIEINHWWFEDWETADDKLEIRVGGVVVNALARSSDSPEMQDEPCLVIPAPKGEGLSDEHWWCYLRPRRGAPAACLR